VLHTEIRPEGRIFVLYYQFHLNVGYTGFDEDIGGGGEAHLFVETDGVRLCVNENARCALTARFLNSLQHEVASEAFAAVGGQHTSDTEEVGAGGEETRVGDDLALTEESQVGGGVVDVVQIRVLAVLLEIEDVEACFDDLVQFRRREFGKGYTMQFDALREGERIGFFLRVPFGCGLLELGTNCSKDKLADRSVPLRERRPAGIDSTVGLLHASGPFGDLLRVSHHDIDDRIDLAEERAVVFLRL